MKQTRIQPEIKIWRPADIGDAELISAAGVTEPLPKHVHTDYAMVVVENGAYKIHHGTNDYAMTAGSFCLAQPGDAISCGASEKAGRAFRALNVSPDLFQNVAAEVFERDAEMPVFSKQISSDKHLTTLFLRIHKSLEKPVSRLESSSFLQELLAYLIARYADGNSSHPVFGRETQAIKRVREYLQDNFAENISLEQIARVAGLSGFHLNRIFRQAVGLPPHAYQMQARIDRAKTLLAAGVSIEQAALEVGFFDQSHFTNHFKRLCGFTPGFYRQNILRR